MSARERILGRGSAKEADKNWVLRRLNQHGAVFFEPWVDRVEELGIQIDVPQNGPPQLLGLLPMIVDERGQYAGSWFAGYESRLLANRDLWEKATTTALSAAVHVQSLGYFGPLGIDAMLYRDIDNTLRIRPLQDINARWTMGRLSLGLRRIIVQDHPGVWLHGPSMENNNPEFVAESRFIRTSPAQVGSDPCRHSSKIADFTPF